MYSRGDMFKDWTPVSPVGDFLPVIARVSARMFAPRSLSRNADYQRLIMVHTVDLVSVIAGLTRIPAAVRPLLAR